MKKVVQFMGNPTNVAFSVDEEVVKQLYDTARANAVNGNASAYVNKLLKFALENYKEAENVPVAAQ